MIIVQSIRAPVVPRCKRSPDAVVQRFERSSETPRAETGDLRASG